MAELPVEVSLELRVAQFRADPDKMQIVNDFLNGVFEQAHKEAQHRHGGKSKSKLDALGLHNGTRRIGQWSNRARNQARTFATRIFTTICNCTNSVRSVVNRN